MSPEVIAAYIGGPALTLLGVILGRRGQKAAAEKTISDAAQSAVLTMKQVLDAQSLMRTSEVDGLLKRLAAAEEATRAAVDHASKCEYELSMLKLKVGELEAVILELRRK